jgi:hypothetical protein
MSMDTKSVEISIHGKWSTVPAMDFNENIIAITGKWVKIAVVHDEDFLEQDFQDPKLCVAKLKQQHSWLRADIFTFAQRIPKTTPAFAYPMEWDSVAAVRTTSFKDWWNKLPQESRKNVRRAQKRGVVVVAKPLDDELVRQIADLNNDAPVRQGRPFVHFGKSLDQVKRDQQSFLDRSDYVCAYFENELIGFMKIAYRGDLASIVQVLPKASHHDKRPANALFSKAIELCEAKGVSYLTYGMFNYGNRSDSSLRLFKIRNGFEEIRVPRFYVPLTIWGKVCTRLKLYRGLIGIVPNSVTKFAAAARAMWYDFRHSSQKAVQISGGVSEP